MPMKKSREPLKISYADAPFVEEFVNRFGTGFPDLVRNAFGARTYARLQKVKAKYDPQNVFRLNQNILPG